MSMDARRGEVVVPAVSKSGLCAVVVMLHHCDSITGYFKATTIESGPTKCSTYASRKPAAFIHSMQSAPV